MSHKWQYAGALVVVVALGVVGSLYYYGITYPAVHNTPVTIQIAGMTSDGVNPISGVHVTATYSGQSFTAVTDFRGQAVFNMPVNTHVILTDDLSGYKTIDTVDSSMFVPMFH